MKLQVKRLKEVVDEKEMDAERFKVKVRLNYAGAQTKSLMNVCCMLYFPGLHQGAGHATRRGNVSGHLRVRVRSCEPVPI